MKIVQLVLPAISI